MKWTNTYIATRKDDPADSEIISDKYLVRAGFIKKLDRGIYTYQNLGLRVLSKIKNIIREILNKENCIEILMPMVQPKSLWAESKRWDFMGDSLLKFKNRNEKEFCLAPTHEEVITDLVRSEIKSYKNLPKNIYHIQTKYRDEIRPRFGLMRCREFLMKDAYSFDCDMKGAFKAYEKMYDCYSMIFKKIGLDFEVVEADTGVIGGSKSHEFHVVAGNGEDQILICDKHSYNVDIAPRGKLENDIRSGLKDIESFDTPNVNTISSLSEFLKVDEASLVKSVFFYDAKRNPVLVLTKGNDEVNQIKLARFLNSPVEFMPDKDVFDLTGSTPGSLGPVDLNGVRIFLDYSLQNRTNFVVGANKKGVHFKNVNYKKDFEFEKFCDVALAGENDICPECNSKYSSKRGIEVGHIFYLGDKYSKLMNATFLDQNQKSQFFEMGCYGIGVSRTMQACVEQNHDDKGICWPLSVAPYSVLISNLDIKDEKVNSVSNSLYQELLDLNLEVLLDDRDVRAGVKFNDADLIGIPIRINVGNRLLKENKVEIIERKTLNREKVSVEELKEKIKNKVFPCS